MFPNGQPLKYIENAIYCCLCGCSPVLIHSSVYFLFQKDPTQSGTGGQACSFSFFFSSCNICLNIYIKFLQISHTHKAARSGSGPDCIVSSFFKSNKEFQSHGSVNGSNRATNDLADKRYDLKKLPSQHLIDSRAIDQSSTYSVTFFGLKKN